MKCFLILFTVALARISKIEKMSDNNRDHSISIWKVILVKKNKSFFKYNLLLPIIIPEFQTIHSTVSLQCYK